MLRRVKRVLVGSPLNTTALHEQRLSKKAALAVFASDALSSTAYATEAVLVALLIGGSTSLHLSMAVSISIVCLLAIVATSYSQTIYAYPGGGGAYTVAKENLGVTPGLFAAAALLIDYVLTVAVSVSAGIAAIVSAFPTLQGFRIVMCLAAILLVVLINLRGVRESATVFGIAVYGFVFSAYALLRGGLYRVFIGGALEVTPVQHQTVEAVWQGSLAILFLKAFASGCTALTGVEAISNGVQSFKQPVSRNASITLFWMAGILGSMFIGITFLANHFGVLPAAGGETVLSQINRRVFGLGPIYYSIQLATTSILILAANTSFADFPRLSSILARDRFLPRQLANMGDRLVFSNGIVVLGLSASALVIRYEGREQELLPLYMVGVFLSFTLSQAGMVVHWRKVKQPGTAWRMAMNSVGAVACSVVLFLEGIVKFRDGAWIVIAGIFGLAFSFRRVRNHYFLLSRALSLADYDPSKDGRIHRHTVIMPVAPTPNRIILTAVEYARSISKDVIAVTVNVDRTPLQEIQDSWRKYVRDVPLIVLEAPYRSVNAPLLRFIDEIEDTRKDDKLTILLPEFVPAKWWHNLLHNQTSLLLKGVLLFRPGIVVTSVPYHLRK